MSKPPDYYTVLGIIPNADPVLIKAAYRALSKLYHPDASGTSESAARFRQITEAYEVLSDEKRRAAYDVQYKHAYGNTSDFKETVGAEYADASANDEDWTVALKYYPDLKQIDDHLRHIAASLSFNYRSYMLSEKQWADRQSIANTFEDKFLSFYFTSKPECLEFAKFLIKSGRKDALREFNKAIQAIGASDSKTIIETILRESVTATRFANFADFDRAARPLSEAYRKLPTWEQKAFYAKYKATAIPPWLEGWLKKQLAERRAREEKSIEQGQAVAWAFLAIAIFVVVITILSNL